MVLCKLSATIPLKVTINDTADTINDKRQSLQPTEVRVDPTGLDSSVTTTHTLTDVTAGSYSVSVMAENENGISQEMTATFVVEGMHVHR